jgi:DNA-binding MarR family transcriptional regulator
VLAVLAGPEPVPSGQAARTLGLDPSTVTRLADRMVSAGHVTRGTSPQHRGVVTLELTASGRDLVATADAWRRHELARIMSQLAAPEQAAVTAALELLVAAAGDDYGVTASRPSRLSGRPATAPHPHHGSAGGRAARPSRCVRVHKDEHRPRPVPRVAGSPV